MYSISEVLEMKRHRLLMGFQLISLRIQNLALTLPVLSVLRFLPSSRFGRVQQSTALTAARTYLGPFAVQQLDRQDWAARMWVGEGAFCCLPSRMQQMFWEYFLNWDHLKMLGRFWQAPWDCAAVWWRILLLVGNSVVKSLFGVIRPQSSMKLGRSKQSHEGKHQRLPLEESPSWRRAQAIVGFSRLHLPNSQDQPEWGWVVISPALYL